MIQPEIWMDIHSLHRQGLSARQIAKQTGHARNTIAKILKQTTPQPFGKGSGKPRKVRESLLDPFKPYVEARYRECGLSAVRLLAEITPQGYTGSVNLVQRFVKTIKAEQFVKAKMTVRFETPPGQQAQADWAEVRTTDGQKLYAFVMVLGFSRMLFVSFTDSMALPELLKCHQEAFAYFGGIPATVLYDNMAQVRLPGSGELNPLMADFALHYGFAVKTHRVRRPRTKGKVERMVDYLKDNFLNGRVFHGAQDLAAQGRVWQEEANRRIHATTKARPADLLIQEGLYPLTGVAPYVLSLRDERRVDVEGFVRWEKSRYSVPPQYVGKRVLVVQKEQRVSVRLGDTIIAEHGMSAAPNACVAAPEHIAALWKETLKREKQGNQGKTPFPSSGAKFVEETQVVTRPLAFYDEVANA